MRICFNFVCVFRGIVNDVQVVAWYICFICFKKTADSLHADYWLNEPLWVVQKRTIRLFKHMNKLYCLLRDFYQIEWLLFVLMNSVCERDSRRASMWKLLYMYNMVTEHTCPRRNMTEWDVLRLQGTCLKLKVDSMNFMCVYPKGLNQWVYLLNEIGVWATQV